MRLVPLGSLKENSVLAKTIYDENGRILLSPGVVLTEGFIKKLYENGVLAVNIVDDYSVGEINEVISPKLRNTATKEIRNVFKAVRMNLGKTIRTLEVEPGKISKRLNLIAMEKYFSGLDNVVNRMMDELLSNRDAMVSLVDIKNMNSFIYEHSIQITVLSLLIGISMKMSPEELKDLAIGAILHDIGLSFIDPGLVIYRKNFTDEEEDIYKSHSQVGYDFIKQNTLISVGVRMAILQHHESFDGKGYPLGLTGRDIHKFARVIAIADCYDEMTSGITEMGWVSPHEALEYIMGNAGTGRRFDFDIANLFVRRVAPFPLGSHVKLSDDRVAIISGYNGENPLRPQVKIIEPNNPLKKGQMQDCDLMNVDNYNITIKKIIYD